MNKKQVLEQAALEITKELTDQGKLIEAGFMAFRHLVMAKDAPLNQVEEMQLAFMAGAELLFSSIMSIMEPGDEPTSNDLNRLDLIHKELEQWRAKLSDRINPVQGRA